MGKKQIVTNETVEKEVEKEETVKTCTKCFQEGIGQGIPHPCTETNKKKNLAELVKKHREVTRLQLQC